MRTILERYANLDFTSYDDFYNNYRVRLPEDFNFAYDVVDEIARLEPDRRAMLWVSREGEEREFTFGQMKDLSDRAAAVFTSLGIGRGDAVMLTLKRRYQFWYVLMGLHKVGARAIPGTHLLTDKDYEYRANVSDAAAIIAVDEPEVIGHLNAARDRMPTVRHYFSVGETKPEGFLDLDALVQGAGGFAPPDPRPGGDDILLAYFTSGTTGYPKLVCQDSYYPAGHIATAWFWHCVNPNGLHFTISDTGWGKAAWGKLYGQWFAGGGVFTYDFDKFDAADILSKLEKYRITTFCAPPTMYRYIIKQPLEEYDLSALEHVTTAGEALNPEVFNRFKEALGLEIFEGFGQTETTLSLATFRYMKPVPGSMGRVTPSYDMRILDAEGNECAIGEPGEICVCTEQGKPYGMFSGYYKDEALTKSVWHDGFYHSGDVAWKDGAGFFWFVGRTDDVIKSSGYRIGPFEVESALMEHPAVLEAAVIGVPDPDRGQVVKAFVVLTQGYEPSEKLKKELQDYVKSVTAPYKYPRLLEFIDVLPKTISGKIMRKDLR